MKKPSPPSWPVSMLPRPLAALALRAQSLLIPPIVNFARSTVLEVLKRVETGRLLVIDADGKTTVCGHFIAAEGEPCTELRILNEVFWLRVLLFADMVGLDSLEDNDCPSAMVLTNDGLQGFAESYMLGDFSCSDLVAFFRIFIVNRESLSNATTLTSSLSSALSNIARGTNTLANAQLNISAHYDISNTMFAAFLSRDMTYSCPIWRPSSDGRGHEETLEEAQERKLQYFIAEARLQASDHVLEIGTGWGSFAIAAVQSTGCRVTTLTLSREQKELAEQRIADAGLSDRIHVLLCDYRAHQPPSEGFYDKVISIEMLEAVGREFLSTYFSCVDRLLKPVGGIAVFQCITMPECRYEAYSKGQDFIRKYIFPGGHLPTVSQLVQNIEAGSKGTLVVDNLRNIGGHYAKTLRMWRNSFESQFASKIKPALLAEHPDGNMSEKDVEVFRRKWQVSHPLTMPIICFS